MFSLLVQDTGGDNGVWTEQGCNVNTRLPCEHKKKARNKKQKAIENNLGVRVLKLTALKCSRDTKEQQSCLGIERSFGKM